MSRVASGKAVAPVVKPQRPIRVGLFGAALDTGNLGVSALGVAALEGIGNHAPAGMEALLFDYGRGVREPCLEIQAPRSRVHLVGGSYSRRLHRPENLRAALWAARLGIGSVHPLVRYVRDMDAILDLSGGDSFTDLYGSWRYDSVSAPKALALALGKMLVLLPQTYGPFARPASRRRARTVLCGATMAWARDTQSLSVMRCVVGAAFSPERHRLGVDVAFGLTARQPSDAAVLQVLEKARSGAKTLLGLNVSGLLYLGGAAASRRFGLAVPYDELVERVLHALLELPESRVLIVSHVVPPCASHEDDVRAAEQLRRRLSSSLAARVIPAPPLGDPREVKWLIGQCDWFCGTRMHACIAAISQGVPTLGIAYSDKTEGVFGSVGLRKCVMDARSPSARGADEIVRGSLAARHGSSRALRDALPEVRQRWNHQFDEVVAAIERNREAMP